MNPFERQIIRRLGKRKRPCCRDRNNLKYAIGLNNKPDIVVLKCSVCKAIHRHVLAENGVYRGKASQ